MVALKCDHCHLSSLMQFDAFAVIGTKSEKGKEKEEYIASYENSVLFGVWLAMKLVYVLITGKFRFVSIYNIDKGIVVVGQAQVSRCWFLRNLSTTLDITLLSLRCFLVYHQQFRVYSLTTHINKNKNSFIKYFGYILSY